MNIKKLKRPSFRETIAWILATWFGSGCAPKAPGTVGSLCSIPLVVIGYLWGTEVFALTIGALFFIGWATVHVVLQSQKEFDPGFVVIDETVGQTLTFLLVIDSGFSVVYLLLGFLLFRLFDIVKVWPASYFDGSIHNAFGVMMDDVVAGLYAGLILYAITFI